MIAGGKQIQLGVNVSRTSKEKPVTIARLRFQIGSLLFLLLLNILGCSSSDSTSFDDISLDDLDAQIAAEPVAPEAETPAPADGDAVEPVATSEALDIEKDTLKFGFIKLTDCAPLVIAKEKGFFEDEGLQVDVEAQPNWKTLLDRVINGELDGSHMLSGQPIAATIGFGTKAHIITAFTMDLNGNGITLAPLLMGEMY